MVDDSLKGGDAAVVHVWGRECDVPQRGRPEFTHVFNAPAMPVHASVGSGVGTATVLVVEPRVVEPCLRCRRSLVDHGAGEVESGVTTKAV